MKLIMGVCAVTWFSAIALADEDPIIDPPTVVTDGISPIAPANYSLTKHELGGSRRKWDISFFLKATAVDGAAPEIVIAPARDGDEIGVLNVLVFRSNVAIPRLKVTIGSGASSQRFRNIGEVQGISSGTTYNNFCAVDLTIDDVQQLVGPDSLSQPKCTINVSRVSLVRTVPNGGYGNAVIDVRAWERNYSGGASELAVEEIDIVGNLTGRVYGGPHDNTTVYQNNINVRPPMRQTTVGNIHAGGVIGRGTSRPRDPAEIGGANVEIGKDGFAFLVEATTIGSISGSTVNIYADTAIDQFTSLDRRITQIQATGTRSSTSGQEDVAGIHGTIKADIIAPVENLPARISCDGDLSANLLLGTRSTTAIGAVRKNGDNTPVIRIGRSFRSGKVI